MDRDAELVTHPLVEAAEQGATAGQRDAAVDDVAGQLRRADVEGGADRSTIWMTGVSMARRTSGDEMETTLGRPVTRSRPRIRVVSSSASGKAEPTPVLMSSALRSPSSSEYRS